MAKGKRVSNKSGGDPGKRSGRGKDRAWANIQRRKALAAPSPVLVPAGAGKAIPGRVPGPNRTSFLRRITAPVRRFFRGG